MKTTLTDVVDALGRLAGISTANAAKLDEIIVLLRAMQPAKTPVSTVEEWNRNYPPGTIVSMVVYDEVAQYRTLSPAWLGDKDRGPVVLTDYNVHIPVALSALVVKGR